MALSLPPGLNHAEVAFVAEMELVTVVPRLRLDSIPLLSGATPPLRPPTRTQLPLWLALLLKKQRRANIIPPPWLHPASLSEIIQRETHYDPNGFSPPPPPPARADPNRPGHARGLYGGASDTDAAFFSPPFQASCTAAAPAGYLPYHWLEVAETLLAHAADDVAGGAGGAGEIRGLLRDLVEVRGAKMRASTSALEGFGGGLMSLRGVGALELAENRAFVLGIVDGVRKIGASTEAGRREAEEAAEGGANDDSDEEMGI